MPEEEYYCILRGGVDRWNRWRKSNPSEELKFSNKTFQSHLDHGDFSNVKFFNCSMHGVSLLKCNLQGAIFDDCDLGHALLDNVQAAGVKFVNGSKLNNAKVPHANFSRGAFERCNCQGLSGDNAIFQQTRLFETDLTKVRLNHSDFLNAVFEGCIFESVQIQQSYFIGCEFKDCDVIGGSLDGSDFRKSSFSKMKFRSVSLQKADVSELTLPVSMINCNLTRTILKRSNVPAASNFESCLFMCAELDGALLIEVKLQGAKFNEAILPDVDMRGAIITGCDFTDADLSRSNLQGVVVNSRTTFKNAEVEGCRIDRFILESLDDYGGLTNGDRMRMKIEDSVAILRASYSGFIQWAHITALGFFVFPYVWFLVQNWALAHLNPIPQAPTIPLWKGFLRFIWNGGENWAFGWNFNAPSFFAFCFAIGYNSLRAILLYKTKKLEMHETITGLPPLFSFASSPGWERAFDIAKWAFYVNLLAVLIHTLNFFKIGIPIIPGNQ